MDRRLQILMLGSWMFMGGVTLMAQEPDASQHLEKGLYLEETKRDLAAAVESYRAVLSDPTAHPELTMRARFRLASCQLKSGSAEEAKATLRGMIDNLPTPEALAADGGTTRTLDRDFAEILERALPNVNRDELLEAAFTGIAKSLGWRADYLDEAKLKNFTVGMNGRLVGIGAALKEVEGKILVTAAIPGSPAEKAKLAGGDAIVRVDGREVGDFKKGLNEVVNAIRGKEGTEVVLTIRKSLADALENVRIVREPVTLVDNPPVVSMSDEKGSWLIDKARGIAGIRITSFRLDTHDKCREAIEAAIDQGMRALVLDLRSNGGGSLQAAVETADQFIDEGVIVRIVSRRKEETKEHRATKDGTFDMFPMVVLVNQETASAAEILAGCLQDHKRALVAGARTTGVGTVRTMMPVAGGGAFVLPVSEFVRASGAKVQKMPGAEVDDAWGIQPDPGFLLTLTDLADAGQKVPDIALNYLKEELAKE